MSPVDVGNVMFWSVWPVNIVLRYRKVIGARTYHYVICWADSMQAICNAAERHWFLSTMWWGFAIIAYIAGRISNDDDRKPRKRRAYGRNKLPRPTLIRLRPAGAT